ncbi:MAG: Calx-beta domain-containing protein [bacterium]
MAASGFAGSYVIPTDQPGWTVTATVSPEPVLCSVNSAGAGAVVMNDPFTVTVQATYDSTVPGSTTTLGMGSDPGVSVVWHCVNDSTWSATVTPGVDTLINGRSMDFRGTVSYSGDNGSASASFSSTIYVHKELVLSMSSPSSSIIDMYLFRPEGFKGSIWPNAAAVNGGKIRVVESGPFNISPKEITTGPKEYDLYRDNGTAAASITAPLASAVDENGYINGTVTLSSTDGARRSSHQFHVSLPFALVANIGGNVILRSRENAIIAPRFVAEYEVLLPGDVVEVLGKGSEDGDLILRFCDGHATRIQSFWGIRIQLGQAHGVDSERSSITFSLLNQSIDVAQNPRDYGRVLITDYIADAAGNALVPGSGMVRWGFRKAGTEGMKYVFEKAGVSKSKALEAASVRAAGSDPFASSTYIHAQFFSDGTLRAQSFDGMVSLSADTVEKSIPAGASVLLNLNADVPEISGLAVNEPAAGSSDFQWSVLNNTVLTNRTPYLEILYAFGEGVFKLNTLECRINGVLATEYCSIGIQKAELRTPPELALVPGTNHLEAAVTCLSGERRTAAVDVIYNASVPPPAPANLNAVSSTNGVWLTWSPDGTRDLLGYHVYRAASESGTVERLTLAPCPVASWLDSTPGGISNSSRWYAIESVFAASATSQRSPAIEASPAPWNTNSPSITLTPQTGGIQIIPADISASYRPCQVERAPSASGPWTNVLGGVYFGPAGMLDTDAAPELDYWYRPVALNNDGSRSYGPPVGAVQRPSGLASLPAGLSVWREAGLTHLRWNPSASTVLGGYHVYRSQGSGFICLATNLPNATTFTDSVATVGDHQWRIVPVSTNGAEGTGYAEISLAWWTASGPIGSFRFTRPYLDCLKTSSFIDLSVERVGGTHEAAFIQFGTQPDTADTNTDFNPIGGTLVFNAGETLKTVRVQLVNDASNTGTETFMLNLTSAAGGAQLEYPSMARISLINSNALPPPEVIGSTNITAAVGLPISCWIESLNRVTRFVADTPPVWLRVNSGDGRFEGTPDTPGCFDVPVTLYNSVSSTTVVFRIQVYGAPALDWQSSQVGTSKWLGACYAQGLYVLAGQAGAIARSANGQSWNSATSGVSVALNGVAQSTNQWIVVGDGGTILCSTDAATWTPRTIGLTVPLYAVAGGLGQTVLVGSNKTIYSSPDTLSWVLRLTNGFNQLAGVAFGNSRFVAVTLSIPRVFVSTNLVQWDQIDASVGTGFDDIAFGNGRFVAVGRSGRIFSSTNGVNWTQEYSPTTFWLRAVCFGEGVFFAVGDAGTILVSVDGQNWSDATWAGAQMLSAVCCGDGRVIIGGQDGLVLSSTLRLDSDGDGISDADEAIAGTDRLDRKSYFRMALPSMPMTNGGFRVQWASQAGKHYAVFQTSSLSTPFGLLQNGILGQPGYTEYFDPCHPTNTVRFYKVVVGP